MHYSSLFCEWGKNGFECIATKLNISLHSLYLGRKVFILILVTKAPRATTIKRTENFVIQKHGIAVSRDLHGPCGGREVDDVVAHRDVLREVGHQTACSHLVTRSVAWLDVQNFPGNFSFFVKSIFPI